MADIQNFIPLRSETVDSITARIDADVNAGVEPEDEAFIDTTPGSFYADVRTAIALELERLWDMASTDIPAAALVEYSWGDYLDDHGSTLDIPRKEPTFATGTVTFTGTNGTVVPAGVEVGVTQDNPDDEPPSFVTTAGGTVAGGTLTVAAVAAESGSASNVASAAIDLILSPVAGLASVTSSAFTGGSDTESDEDYRDRLKRAWSATQGSGSVADYERWALSYAGVGNVRVGPLYDGAGTVRVVITDVDNNPVSTTVRDEVQALIDPFSAETLTNGAITNLSTTGTITVDSTTGFTSSGRIYVGGYLVNYTGLSSTTFTGCTATYTGNLSDNTQVVQHGLGLGLAPVGAMVTVATPTTLTVNVSVTLSLQDGYSTDGLAGTIDVTADVEEVLTAYINGLPPGGENPPGAESPAGSGVVLLKRVEAELFRVPGIYSVSNTQLNASATNLTVTASQVPEIGTITLA